MNRAQILEDIIKIVDPIDPIDENTVIADSDDLDSLALFNIVVYLKNHGYQGSFEDLSKCKTLGQLADLIA